MKIAFCHHLKLSYWGGGERFIVQTSKELARRGHEIEIHALPLMLEGKKKIDPNQMLNGIPYDETWHKKIDAEVAYVTYNPLSWINWRIKGKKIAGIHAHAYWQPLNWNYGLLPNMANIVNRFIGHSELNRFDAVHMVTSAYPIDHERVYTIPNFVDSSVFKPCAPKRERFTVAFSGRAVWQKGWDVFQGIREKLNRKMDFKASCGMIPEEEMPAFLSSSHAVIVPSRVDTFGISVIEALLCGTPVITTPLITHKALDVPLLYASSIEEYEANLAKLKGLWKDGLYPRLSKRLRESAMKYDKAEIVDRIERMFMDVVDNNTVQK